MARLSGKNVVITGGSSGIGLATAKLFQAQGARIAVTGRNAKTLEEARQVLGDEALILASDTSKVTDIEALVAKVSSAFGTVDVLFVNAGIAKFGPLEHVTDVLFDETFAINTKGALLTVQKFEPLLRPGSAVVLNTSVAGEIGFPGSTVYAASKAALRSLARTLAAEFLPKGIRVNAVSPGPITTPIFAKGGVPPEVQEAMKAGMRESNPMKRFGKPEEVADAVLYLGIDATYTTGAELPVDGGLTQL
jgi:NAD(P)-dependent dehydrogenase (short-subunit alcohol dehydrogenase family)